MAADHGLSHGARSLSGLCTGGRGVCRRARADRPFQPRQEYRLTVRTFKLTVAYDGTDFFGWQRQAGRRTVQAELESAIEQATGHRPRTLASSRTDAGVHALGQCVGVRVATRLNTDVLLRALNAILPQDIAVREVVETGPEFHPLRSIPGKSYRYVIYDGPVRDVFARRYCWHFRRGALDAAAMQAAAQSLIGTHDFRSFSTSGSPRKSTIRTVSQLSVCRVGLTPLTVFSPRSLDATLFGPDPDRDIGSDLGRDQSWVVFEVTADGFLYNMVRNLVGTLVEVGRGVHPPTWTSDVLNARDRRRAGPTAPPQGLFLVNVMLSR